jgi:hypothetical protein
LCRIDGLEIEMIDIGSYASRLGSKLALLALIVLPIVASPAAAQSTKAPSTDPAVVAAANEKNELGNELLLALVDNSEAMALSIKCGVLSDLGATALRIDRAELLARTTALEGASGADTNFDLAVQRGDDARSVTKCDEVTKSNLRRKQEDLIMKYTARAVIAQRAAAALPWAAGILRIDGLDETINGLVGMFTSGPRAAEIQALANQAGAEVGAVLIITCPQRPKLPNGQARQCPALDENLSKARAEAQTWLISAEMIPAVAATAAAKKPVSWTLPGVGYARYMPYKSRTPSGAWEDGQVRCEFGDPVIAIAPATKFSELPGQSRALIRFGDGAPIGQVTLETKPFGRLKVQDADANAVAAGVEITNDGTTFRGDLRGSFWRCR